MAKANPFRFATKYRDDESDLLYYGYRYCNANTGRWLARDPKGERGGGSLYEFAGNSPLDACDPLGLSPLWYTLQVDPSESDDPTHVGFYPNAIFLPVTYPKDGAKCPCRGQLLGIAIGAAWIDLSTSLGLKDVQPDYYNNVVSPWPYWDAASKRVFENPRYVGAGFTAIWRHAPGGAQACCRNLVWYNYIVHDWWWNTGDGRFPGNQFVDSPGGLRPPADSFSRTYKLVLKCEDPGWPAEELGHWYWGVDVQFRTWQWTGTFYPPTSDVIRTWPL
jgi:RHS repeat-associated protein